MKRILLVERDELVCKKISSILSDYGFEVHIAQTVDGAKNIFFEKNSGRSEIDLVISEMDFSNENTLALCKSISKNVPIVIYHGRPQETSLNHFIDFCHTFVPKKELESLILSAAKKAIERGRPDPMPFL